MNEIDLLGDVEYRFDACCVFSKVKEQYGGMSNMSNDFKIRVNGILIKNTEALYQACRFPEYAEVQREILQQGSGMSAKMKSKHHRPKTREDWEEIKVEVMRWCIRVKLAQNSKGFKELLLSTEDRPIVENSHKDRFWGAVPINDNVLSGKNVLGKLLMEAREECRLAIGTGVEHFRYAAPPVITNFKLLGKEVEAVGRKVSAVD